MSDKPLTGTILDEQLVLTLNELASICSCNADWIVDLVEEGILEPLHQDTSEWRFSAVCVVRVRTATRLYRDLNVNLAGVALAIDLLDEISELRSKQDMLDI